MFLGNNKLMLGKDCELIYKSKNYYIKRLKVLEKEKYIRRVDRLYIKLDDKGTKMVKYFGYDYSFMCRKKKYMKRVKEIARIAALSIDSTMEFVASWNLKSENVYTEQSRMYVGELKYLGAKNLVYYVSKDKEAAYIRLIINDIQKIVGYSNIIIFMENYKFLSNSKSLFFANESTRIIDPTQQNLDIMRKLEKGDVYQIIREIYKGTEILLSNWKKANYMTEDRIYIVVMPFIDITKLHSLNLFFNNNPSTNRKIDIITLKENKSKINEILVKEINIIELDEWLEKLDEEPYIDNNIFNFNEFDI